MATIAGILTFMNTLQNVYIAHKRQNVANHVNRGGVKQNV